MSSFKRPALKKKAAPCDSPAVPSSVAAAVASASPAQPGVLVPAAPAASAGLLGNILQSVRKLDESRTKAGIVEGAAKGAEERAAEARRQYEQDGEALMRAHVLDPEDEAAFFDFAHAERPWRDLLHDVAAGLGLHSETNEDAEGERFVTKPLSGAMARPTAAELQQLARKQAPKQARPKLSDAPPPPDALQAVVRLNVKKRDLRTIEEVQLDMKAKKEPRMEDGGAP